MFEKILIANRGEIACRIARTLRAMHVRSVAVSSEADRGAMHARSADEVRVSGPAEPRASYLNIEALIAATKATGAQAIHPGYGFLAENAAFAAAVPAATWQSRHTTARRRNSPTPSCVPRLYFFWMETPRTWCPLLRAGLIRNFGKFI